MPRQHVPTSILLEDLVRDVPDQVTLAWLTARLGRRAFGIVLLLLGLLGTLPAVSVVAGLLLTIPAFQMLRADIAPIFPRRIAMKTFTSARLRPALCRLIPVLTAMERVVHPRWETPFEATKRAVGAVIMLLSIGLLVPIPLSNVPVGLTIILVAFAYLEADGLLLAVAGTVILLMLAAAAFAAWETIAAATKLVG